MGKGHKDRRREQRARELEQRSKDEQELKDEVQREQKEKFDNYQTLKKQNTEEVRQPEKIVETSSDTDSGLGSSTTLSTEQKKHRSLIKGLQNLGNTCFFNVVIQSLAHTNVLIDRLFDEKINWIENDQQHYFSTMTSQLLKIFDEFSSNEKKRPNIDPRPLFNALIQRIPCYKGYDQHDSHEFFMNLMLILRAEEIQLRKLKPRSIVYSNDDTDPSKMFCLIGCNEPYTYYDSIFGGHFLDILTCKKCQKCLMKIEPFLGILLPMTDQTSPSENYRQRRKRDDYAGTRTKKEPKILSRKQQKALKKQEKRNSRRSAGATNRLKGRNAAKKKPAEIPLPPTEDNEEKSEETPTVVEPSDAQTELSVSQTDEPEIPAETEEKTEKDGNEDDEEDEEEAEEKQADEDESDADDEPKGPLTTTESTCMLADMVSKLTLIHETSCRPLPFVDENIAQQFLLCNQTNPTTTTTTTNSEDAGEMKTLDNCFQRFFRCETLSGENSFDCYYCRSLEQGQKRVLTEATRQTIFFQLPPILPIFLKRFQMHGSHSEKINKYIQFPLELDLTSRCSTQVKSNTFRYSLYAVIEHTGTLRSGHYVAYVKQSFTDEDLAEQSYSKPIDELLKTVFHSGADANLSEKKKRSQTPDPSIPPPAWYFISDSSIHKVPESKVLEADAYVLFYRKI